jgi:hypothetical protein
VFCGWLWRLVFQSFSLFICNQAFKVVTIRAIAAEGVFVEQAFDSAACAHLVGTALRTDGPTHPAMPASAKNHGGSGHPGGQQAHGPEPAGTLFFHRIRVRILLVSQKEPAYHYLAGYDDSPGRAMTQVRDESLSCAGFPKLGNAPLCRGSSKRRVS